MVVVVENNERKGLMTTVAPVSSALPFITHRSQWGDTGGNGGRGGGCGVGSSEGVVGLNSSTGFRPWL
jgi:hypothetical protein